MLRSPERGLRGITREKAPRPWVKTRELQVHLGQQSTQAGSGQGQHVTEVLSLILPALYLGCAIWWDCLAQTPPSIPELQQLAEATQIGEPASSSAEVRQLVDHLSEQAREVASEASMERTPRALAMWMAGLTLAFAISIALAQKAAKKVKDSTASTGSPLAVGQLGHSMSMHYCQLKSTLLLMDGGFSLWRFTVLFPSLVCSQASWLLVYLPTLMEEGRRLGKVAAEQEQGLCTGLSIIVRLDGLLTRAALRALLLIKQTKQIQNASLNLSYSLAEESRLIKTTARAYIVLFSVQGRYENPFPLGKKIAYCPTGVEENSLRPRADRKKQASDLIAHVSKGRGSEAKKARSRRRRRYIRSLDRKILPLQPIRIQEAD
ncbi:hypothetical protein V6N12_076052 [Hibiscus sabdariffa]|uniref:Uncharacterized protein n=1 Tax=Hibiscus sabdariffa TaxID=183260 RepID=A0ABR2AY84_9ROSI